MTIAIACHIKPAVLVELETGQHEPPLKVLRKLARTLQVDMGLWLEHEEEGFQ